MSVLNIMFIAVALAMDAFAVSIAVGLKLNQINGRQIFRLSWHFGLFQALMPLLGWSTGCVLLPYIKHYAHWIAFGLLFIVGGNMVREALCAGDEDDVRRSDPTKGLNLVVLSVATSIDALAVGFSLSLLKTPIAFPALIIGLVAGSVTVVGLHIGRTLSRIPTISSWAEIAGGLVLWGIGFNILVDHDVFTVCP